MIPFNKHTVETDSGSKFDLQDVASTAVSSYAWKPDSSELAVLFKSDDRVLYVYSGVTSTQAEALETAPSKGAFIIREIKMKHTYRKEVIK